MILIFLKIDILYIIYLDYGFPFPNSSQVTSPDPYPPKSTPHISWSLQSKQAAIKPNKPEQNKQQKTDSKKGHKEDIPMQILAHTEIP